MSRLISIKKRCNSHNFITIYFYARIIYTFYLSGKCMTFPNCAVTLSKILWRSGYEYRWSRSKKRKISRKTTSCDRRFPQEKSWYRYLFSEDIILEWYPSSYAPIHSECMLPLWSEDWDRLWYILYSRGYESIWLFPETRYRYHHHSDRRSIRWMNSEIWPYRQGNWYPHHFTFDIYFCFKRVKLKISIPINKIAPIPNPIRQERSPVRKKKFTLHCFSAGSKAIQRGTMLIRRMILCMRLWYRSLVTLPWRRIASPVTKNTARAIIAIYTGTFSPSGLRYMIYPVRRLSDIIPSHIRFFCFWLRASIEVYFWFDGDIISSNIRK